MQLERWAASEASVMKYASQLGRRRVEETMERVLRAVWKADAVGKLFKICMWARELR
jgi:hypothetical protein